jgi:type VI secretion system protein ImpI/type VI secretion system protein
MLTLMLLRGPDAALAAERRDVEDGPFSIGRAPGNEWALADPDRHLSKRHCVIARHGAEWRVTDLSTNGTFLNREPEPIGVGSARELRDGDVLRLGAYEIEVRVAADVPLPPPAPFGPLRLFDDVPLNAFDEPVRPDHTPAIEDAFRPPRALLGEDWDLDLSHSAALAAALAAGRAAAPPPATPVLPQAAAPAADLLAAFLRGAGMPDARVADPEAAMESLGAAFRALVVGLRAALVARAEVKGAFRIEQTQIRPRGNNPLKFAAGEEDALAALLGAGRRTTQRPADAVAEALRDLQAHELATMAALQAAARALLMELAPARLRDEAGALLPAQRKARAWDAYEAQHARLAQTLSDASDSPFARAFARAYERALAETGRG